MNDAFGSPQSVLVFGATSEIAQEIVRLLVAGRTRTVILAGRDRGRLERFAAEVSALGVPDVDAVAFDALDTADHARLVDEIMARHHDIDLVLFAFGTLGDPARVNQDPAAALPVAQVNYLGAIGLGLAIAAHLRRQGHGTMVVLSSVAGVRVRRDNFVYGSAKAGLDGFFQGMAADLAGSGVRVLIVRPGFVASRMTAGLPPAPFATTPGEVARLTVAGLAGNAQVVWAPPVLRSVMGVLRILPGAVFRRLPR